MAQKQHLSRQQKSDFPIFEYLDMVMPHRLIARWLELPRHYRWLIISILASAVILWIFLKVVVGGLYAYIDSQIPRGYDALYLPYALETRALPELPETISEDTLFVVLPETIAETYALQIPLSQEEMEAANAAELEAFLALSTPVEQGLVALQESLAKVLEERAAAITETQAASTEAAALEADVTAAPTLAPTVDTVQLQATAVNIALAELSALSMALADSDSIQPVFDTLPKLREAMAGLIPTGVTLLSLDPFIARLDELAEIKPPAVYKVSDCLVSSKMVVRRADMVAQTCPIDQTATFVEWGDYQHNDTIFNVVVAEYPDHDTATRAVKQVFQYARTIGSTGNFSLGPIEYDYAFSHADSLYTFTWSHENWVYSITTDNFAELENLVKVFPY
ncbi:MAG TPA: hypothetical protein VKY59_08590 [Spirillospora sp.]|nr:hypothetical protein [Spirillospora sp.]